MSNQGISAFHGQQHSCGSCHELGDEIPVGRRGDDPRRETKPLNVSVNLNGFAIASLDREAVIIRTTREERWRTTFWRLSSCQGSVAMVTV